MRSSSSGRAKICAARWHTLMQSTPESRSAARHTSDRSRRGCRRCKRNPACPDGSWWRRRRCGGPVAAAAWRLQSRPGCAGCSRGPAGYGSGCPLARIGDVARFREALAAVRHTVSHGLNAQPQLQDPFNHQPHRIGRSQLADRLCRVAQRQQPCGEPMPCRDPNTSVASRSIWKSRKATASTSPARRGRP